MPEPPQNVAPPLHTAAPPSSPSTVLDVRGVWKTFSSRQGDTTTAVAAVDAAIAAGQFVSLVGPSGCGKTTLMKICAGLVTASEGVIDFNGTGVPVQPGAYGIVFQGAALLPWRTVLDNVLLPADVARNRGKHIDARARELLRLVNLGDVAGKYPGELSGGMRQRVAIARALVQSPPILFMDEPFGALDAMTREELNLQLQEIHLNQGTTVLFVTHSIQEAVLLSDRILVMSSGPGRIVADLTVDIARPRSLADTLRPDFRGIEQMIREHLEGSTTASSPMRERDSDGD